jgi:hypothetical protein
MRDLIYTFVIFFVGFAFGIGNSCVRAQTTYYSNNYGQMMGVANTVGYQTYYSNSYGQMMGVATTIPPMLPAAGYSTPSPTSPSPTNSLPAKFPPLQMAPLMPIMQAMPMLGM